MYDLQFSSIDLQIYEEKIYKAKSLVWKLDFLLGGWVTRILMYSYFLEFLSDVPIYIFQNMGFEESYPNVSHQTVKFFIEFNYCLSFVTFAYCKS